MSSHSRSQHQFHRRTYSTDLLDRMASAKEYEVGDWVMLSDNNHQEGIILYIGNVSGKNNIQYGIELTDFSIGNHNGTYQGKYYFEVNRYIIN